MVFIDLEKTCDKVSRKVLSNALKSKDIYIAYIRTLSPVSQPGEEIHSSQGKLDFLGVVLHLRENIRRCLRRLSNCYRTKSMINIDLLLIYIELWRKTLQTREFLISRSKTEKRQTNSTQRYISWVNYIRQLGKSVEMLIIRYDSSVLEEMKECVRYHLR
ncbi:hypothetical protein Lal_00023029 [Lupinus albus]|nr:hypothetical protein Lal_00023029 [Lupinus albus]